MMAGNVETDARLLWLRRAGDGTILEYVAIEASYARHGEEAIFVGGTRQQWRAERGAGRPLAASPAITGAI